MHFHVLECQGTKQHNVEKLNITMWEGQNYFNYFSEQQYFWTMYTIF